MLIGYARYGDHREIARHNVSAISKLIDKNLPIKVCIPLVALGEVLKESVQSEKDGDTILSDLKNQIIPRLKPEFPVPSSEAYFYAKELMERGSGFILPTDALIFSQALTDHNALYLLTTDNLQTNKHVLDLKRELGSKIVIKSDLRR